MAILLVDVDFDVELLTAIAQCSSQSIRSKFPLFNMQVSLVRRFCHRCLQLQEWRLNYVVVNTTIDRLQNVIDFFVIHGEFSMNLSMDQRIKFLENLIMLKHVLHNAVCDLDQRINPQYWAERTDLE